MLPELKGLCLTLRRIEVPYGVALARAHRAIPAEECGTDRKRFAVGHEELRLDRVGLGLDLGDLRKQPFHRVGSLAGRHVARPEDLEELRTPRVRLGYPAHELHASSSLLAPAAAKAVRISATMLRASEAFPSLIALSRRAMRRTASMAIRRVANSAVTGTTISICFARLSASCHSPACWRASTKTSLTAGMCFGC